MEWELFSQQSHLTNFFADSVASASDIWTSVGDLIGNAPNLDADTTYYLKVTDWDSSGGTYTISVTRGSSDGSMTMPTSLTSDGSSYAGGIDKNGYSYYSFTTTGGSYVISLSGFEVPANVVSWTLYSDPAFPVMTPRDTCNNDYYYGTKGETSCAAPNLAAGTYYLKVYNYGSEATSYSIAVTPDTGGYAGGAPVSLALDTHATGTILDNQIRYYSFTAQTPGTYTITFTTTLVDGGWSVYSDSGYSTLVKQCDTTSSAGTEQCSTSNIASGTYYIKALNN